MGYEFEEGVKRGMEGKTSTGFSDEVCPFRDDEMRAERERGHEAGLAAKAMADALAESRESENYSSSDSSDYSDSSSYHSSSSTTSSEGMSFEQKFFAGLFLLIAIPALILGVIVVLQSIWPEPFWWILHPRPTEANVIPMNGQQSTMTEERTKEGEYRSYPILLPSIRAQAVDDKLPLNTETVTATMEMLFWAGCAPMDPSLETEGGLDLRAIDIRKPYYEPVPGEHIVALIDTTTPLSEDSLWNYQAIDDEDKLMMSFQVASPYHLTAVQKYANMLHKRLRIVESHDRLPDKDGTVRHYVLRSTLTPQP